MLSLLCQFTAYVIPLFRFGFSLRYLPGRGAIWQRFIIPTAPLQPRRRMRDELLVGQVRIAGETLGPVDDALSIPRCFDGGREFGACFFLADFAWVSVLEFIEAS